MERVALTLCAAAVIASSGCNFYRRSIPAHLVHPSARRPQQENLVRVNLKTLQVPPGEPYRLQAGDVLSINSPGLFPDRRREMPVPTALPTGARPRIRPSTGYPFVVNADGTLRLPGIAPVDVSGQTIEQAEVSVRRGFAGVLRPQDVTVSLLLPRTKSILVVREDAVPQGSATQTANAETAGTRYRGQVFDLQLEPDESDVLTAIVRSGGLPGLDAKNDIAVLRRRFETDDEKADLLRRLGNSANAADTAAKDDAITEVIPLRIPAGTEPRQHNIALRPGDVLLIENRQGQVFYTGGAFLTGTFPLPRDKPLDVLQAVAIAGGTQSGLDYGAGGLQGVASVGDATSLVPPTWVILVRQYEDRQVSFKIDLLRALWDPRHRVIVQAGDYLHLAYKPSEIAGNVSLKNFGTGVRMGLRKGI